MQHRLSLPLSLKPLSIYFDFRFPSPGVDNAASKTEGVEIELPDFDEFFGRIQAVSPLARLVIEGGGSGEGGGFAAVDDTGER